MVYKTSDIKHLDLMSSLSKKEAKKIEFDFSDKSNENNLDADILKLCNGLRENKFYRYAEVLENKFIVLKKAQADLYKVMKESGEDLLGTAHPKGDVKVSDAQDNHGDVETGLSQQKKSIEIANKQPTGKLACDKIVNLCLIALGQQKTAKYYLDRANKALDKYIADFVDDFSSQTLNEIKKVINYNLTTNDITNLRPEVQKSVIGNIADLVKNKIKAIETAKEIKPEIISEEEEKNIEKRNIIYDKLKNILQKELLPLIHAAGQILDGSEEGAKFQENISNNEMFSKIFSNNLKTVIKTVIKSVNNIVGKVNNDQQKNALNKIKDEANNILAYLNSKTPGSFDELNNDVLKLTTNFNELKSYDELHNYIKDTIIELNDFENQMGK